MPLGEKKILGYFIKRELEERREEMQYMALAGWDANQMLEGTARILSAASATGEDLAAVCDIITDGLSAFGMQANESAHFADVLASTATNANTTIEMMGEAFTYADSVAGAFNYSIEDTALAIGLMANSGKPIRVIVTGTPINYAMTIESLTYSEVDGTGDVYFSLELKEYKFIVTTKQTTKTSSGTILTTPNTTRQVKSPSDSYVVKKGDTLWLIAKKVTGDGSNYKAIATKNNITNPNKIYVGQKLVI